MISVEHWRLRDGTPLTLRPVRAQDGPALRELIESLPPRDRRWRFHGAVMGVTPERLQRMTRPDPRRELALAVIAKLPRHDVLVADARFVIDGTGEGAEFALMVSAAWRRLGVGALAMVAMQRAARKAGLRWLHGSLLADNVPMLGLMQHCGFLCAPARGDADMVAVEARVDCAAHSAVPAGSPGASDSLPPWGWRWSMGIKRGTLQL